MSVKTVVLKLIKMPAHTEKYPSSMSAHAALSTAWGLATIMVLFLKLIFQSALLRSSLAQLITKPIIHQAPISAVPP